jgi:ATP-dependent Clp protease ATP-binding subunit ClpA
MKSFSQYYEEFSQELVSKYGDSAPTIARFLDYTLPNPEIIQLFKKYNTDVKKLSLDLKDYLKNHEYQLTIKTSSSGYFEDDMEDLFSIMGGRLRNRPRYSTKEMPTPQGQPLILLFQKIAKRSAQIEQEKFLKQLQENPGNQFAMNQVEISYSSLLRATLEVCSKDPGGMPLYKIIKDSGFQISNFISDDQKFKTDKPGIIEELCENLNEKALEGEIFPVIGREVEVDRVINILKKIRKNNPILVGPAGVGKTAIAEGLALKIIKGEVPEFLKKAVIYNLQVMNLVKGTEFRGKFEQKISDLLEEFKTLEKRGNVFPILFIDEIHTIMGAGNNSSLDFANMIKPALARGDLRTIGATTTDEYHEFIKTNAALERRFYPVIVNEPSEADTFHMLNGLKDKYEAKHQVKYLESSLQRAIELSQEWVPENRLPDKAFDLIDEAGVICYRNGKKTVEPDDVAKALAKAKNLDYESIVQSEKGKLSPIEPQIKKIIFGQDHAVSAVSKVVEKHRAGLNAKDKPVGAFLFCGPTGTGKTELAKQVASKMKAYFHRIDMSEYMEPHSVSKLLGAPAGYIGYNHGSSLTKILGEHPKTVLLLDEIEKAHPQIWNILLQAMDNAKITDSKGQSISLKNVLIIMTSNAGSQTMMQKNIGIGGGEKISEGLVEINRIFPPEFRARLNSNGAIIFNSLSKELMEKILEKELKFLQESRLNSLKIKLELSNEVKEFLVAQAVSKNLGARPLKEMLEDKIVDPLVEEILYGKLKENKNSTKVKVELKNQEVILDLIGLKGKKE